MSSGAALDIFDLRDTIVTDYERFAKSFTKIHAQDIREQVDAIYARNRYWPEPLIQINPNYQRSSTIRSLVDEGILAPECADIFQFGGTPLTLYKHQVESIVLANSGESYVVTTGTGSGKSLCFFIPIIHRILEEKKRDSTAKTRAIIIYPMNALANSQLEEVKKFVENVPGTAPITIARYTGQEHQKRREEIAENPPDILLTNFMMLEMLMTRQEAIDQRVMSNCEGLRFLVLDELHTYRGRQGADVALLIRRVRERLKPENLQCIGTSATMASEGSDEEKKRVVADVASRLFSVPITEPNVIGETLERITDPEKNAENTRHLLADAVTQLVPRTASNDDLAAHALAVWVELNLGIVDDGSPGGLKRAKPLTLTQSVERLAADSGLPPDTCRAALLNVLTVCSIPENERTPHANASSRSFFAFKLHQFISGAGHAYATLEPPPHRVVTVEGQQFLPAAPEKRLYPVHFCRECGHEYHPVRLADESASAIFFARSIDDAPPAKDAEDPDDTASERNQLGFITLHPENDPSFTFDDDDEDYPESWIEEKASGKRQLKPHHRNNRARRILIEPSGLVGSGARAWFIPGSFRFCLRCQHAQSSTSRDRNRLASLSAEGRSSATTVLVTSALRWMHGETSTLAPTTRKLLGFTDNRQDAALQAGHFNDFLFVSLLRAGFLRALQHAGDRGIRSAELGQAIQSALRFDSLSEDIRAEWLQVPELKGFQLQEAESTLRAVLAHRAWFDQRRGWRYTNPNLEQLQMVSISYRGLEELAKDQSAFANAPDLLKHASPTVRTRVYTALFDHLRQELAIKSVSLDRVALDGLEQRSKSALRAPWGFGTDERPSGARWMMAQWKPSKKSRMRDLLLLVRSGPQSAIGKILKSKELWGNDRAASGMKRAQYEELLNALLLAAKVHGFVSEERTPFDVFGWQLNDQVVEFRLATPSTATQSSKNNAFFQQLYENLADALNDSAHPLFGFEAREHTAQVDSTTRQIREWRFRYGPKEIEDLNTADAAKKILEANESRRFLPLLFCSPTMELGVDISALNVVYMRNVPPTPANYAQRSGRAGRSGQAALVLTYASSQGPHDQYFFNDPTAMVYGEVRAPLLDLANRDLVDSHLQAVWLSCVPMPLAASIGEMLDLDAPSRPLLDDIRAAMQDPAVAHTAKERIRRVLALIEPELTADNAPWYTGRDAYTEAVVAAAFENFDKAFQRWRTLLKAAEEQRDAAQRIVDSHSTKADDKRAAKSREAQARKQIDLLRQGREQSSSDFYTYRYLATEGFLPGYNFPRLPLMAYIPSSIDGRGRQTYLQRPRFLALSEFGPRSLVYHEGRAFRVVRAMLSLDQLDSSSAQAVLPTESVRICASCGGGHFHDDDSVCHACGEPLGDAEIVHSIYRIENVATQHAERITANDEERQRQGFELQTTFRWAQRDHALDVRRVRASDEHGEVASLSYGPGATITRLNKGLRRRANKSTLGFMIDPITGYWAAMDADDSDKDPNSTPRQLIVPAVRDHKNALLFIPADGTLECTTLATLQYALLRGIESVFELEEGEILGEPIPTRENRKGCLFYEATEGGAGVLTRLVVEPQRLAEVATAGLYAMHFDVRGPAGLPSTSDQLVDRPDTACVAACYRCLMSYYNQPDHEYIDRRDATVRELLLRLARSTTAIDGHVATPSIETVVLSDDDTSSGEAWLRQAKTHGIPPPDEQPLALVDTQLPLVWRSDYVIASLEPLSPALVNYLDSTGFAVIMFDDRATWPLAFERLQSALGRSS